MTWLQGLSTAQKIAATIGAVVAALLAVANLLEAGEPYWIATRGFVASKVEETNRTIGTRLIDTQLVLEQSERRRMEATIKDRSALIEANPTMPAAARALIEEMIADMREQAAAASRRIIQLEKEKGRGRP